MWSIRHAVLHGNKARAARVSLLCELSASTDFKAHGPSDGGRIVGTGGRQS